VTASLSCSVIVTPLVWEAWRPITSAPLSRRTRASGPARPHSTSAR
jgi:hypothetical protein